MKYTNYEHIHPFLRMMLSHNDYEYNDDPKVISATSIMKPVNMIVLERANSGTDKEMDLEGMIPSVYGSALHSKMEIALEQATDEMWKMIGVNDPEDLEVKVEERGEIEIQDYKISGKYDIMFKYKGSNWQILDLKTFSVWKLIIDLPGAKEEWSKQMSIYKAINASDSITVDDIGVILYLITDWSKSDSIIKKKQGYPESRIGSIDISLMSISETENYLNKKVTEIKAGLDLYSRTGKTGFECSEAERWVRKSGFAYYSKAGAKRATKVVDTFDQAESLRAKAKDHTAYVEERKAQSTRCGYCSVTQFCDLYSKMIITGEVKI